MSKMISMLMLLQNIFLINETFRTTISHGLVSWRINHYLTMLAYDLQVPTKQLVTSRYPIFFGSFWLRYIPLPYVLTTRNTIISYVASISSMTFFFIIETSKSENMIPIIRPFMINYTMFFLWFYVVEFVSSLYKCGLTCTRIIKVSKAKTIFIIWIFLLLNTFSTSIWHFSNFTITCFNLIILDSRDE